MHSCAWVQAGWEAPLSMQAAPALPGNKVQAALLHHICNHQHEHCQAAPQGEAVPDGVALHCGEQALACTQGSRLAPAVGQGNALSGQATEQSCIPGLGTSQVGHGCLPDPAKAGSRVQQRGAAPSSGTTQQAGLIWRRLMPCKPFESWASSSSNS